MIALLALASVPVAAASLWLTAFGLACVHLAMRRVPYDRTWLKLMVTGGSLVAVGVITIRALFLGIFA